MSKINDKIEKLKKELNDQSNALKSFVNSDAQKKKKTNTKTKKTSTDKN